MSIINRKRVIRPSSREETSKYRVNLEGLDNDGIAYINITHESKPFNETYKVSAKDLNGKKNLYFLVEENMDKIEILWQGDIKPKNESKN